MTDLSPKDKVDLFKKIHVTYSRPGSSKLWGSLILCIVTISNENLSGFFIRNLLIRNAGDKLLMITKNSIISNSHLRKDQLETYSFTCCSASVAWSRKLQHVDILSHTTRAALYISCDPLSTTLSISAARWRIEGIDWASPSSQHTVYNNCLSPAPSISLYYENKSWITIPQFAIRLTLLW